MLQYLVNISWTVDFSYGQRCVVVNSGSVYPRKLAYAQRRDVGPLLEPGSLPEQLTIQKSRTVPPSYVQV